MKVAIVMGSISDYEVVKPAKEILKKFGVTSVVRVLSAHRTPEETLEFAKNAESDGFDVIIAAAGKAAHLAGVIAGKTVIPVIGIPVKSSTMDGMDSLLSVVQMPNGIPVATVAINGAQNAGLLAVQILGTKYAELRIKMKEYREKMRQEVLAADKEISLIDK